MQNEKLIFRAEAEEADDTSRDSVLAHSVQWVLDERALSRRVVTPLSEKHLEMKEVWNNYLYKMFV